MRDGGPFPTRDVVHIRRTWPTARATTSTAEGLSGNPSHDATVSSSKRVALCAFIKVHTSLKLTPRAAIMQLVVAVQGTELAQVSDLVMYIVDKTD